jgi:bud site selection protein 20
VHRAARTRVRTRDLDLIQHHDLQPEERAKLENQPIDEEKPGLGQHVSISFTKLQVIRADESS